MVGERAAWRVQKVKETEFFSYFLKAVRVIDFYASGVEGSITVAGYLRHMV